MELTGTTWIVAADGGQARVFEERLRATFEQWQSAIDERIRAVLPNFAAFSELQQEVKRLSDRLDELEKRAKDGNPPPAE